MNNMHGEHEHHDGVGDDEIRSWKTRLIGAWTFTIPIAILMIGMRFFDILMGKISEDMIVIISLIIAFPVIFVFGFNTIKSGTNGLVRFYFNMDSLIALGTIQAPTMSVLELVIDLAMLDLKTF